MIEKARQAVWRRPSEDLVERVAGAEFDPPVPPSPEPRELELHTEAVPDVRSGSTALTEASGEIFASFEGGEIACRVEEGPLPGGWSVRGTAWLSDLSLQPLALEWIDGDHVLSSISIAHGEPFRLEEIAGRGWHLELRLGDGRAFALRPPQPGAGDGRT